MAQKSNKTDNKNGDMVWPFTKINYIYFAISLLLMIIGFVMLGQGSDTWAPIILVIAYCVVMPIAILKREQHTEDSAPVTED